MEKQKAQLMTKIWRPLLRELTDLVEQACLRRDAYLDHVFDHEAKALKDEIPAPNSSAARAYLQSRLDELDRVSVNFSLSPATIDAVNSACEELNIIRDCFINRVLFLLVASTDKCEVITNVEFRYDIPNMLGDFERDSIYTPRWGGGLSAVSEIVSSDPFWALRNIIHYRREHGDESVTPLHACVIEPYMFSKQPPGVSALNCYLPDDRVPGSPAFKTLGELLDEVLGEPTKRDHGDPKPETGRKKAK